MFQEVRRKDREMDRAAAEEILLNGNYGVLSMNGENDYAYGVPLSYVFDGKSIYVHCAPEGQKLNRIRRDNRVTFCVVEEAVVLRDLFSMQYRSAIAFGKAFEVGDEEKLEALIALAKKYSGDEYLEKGKTYAANSLKKTAVIRIDVEHVTGKHRKR